MNMMVALLFLLPHLSNPDQVLDRYVAFRKATPSLAVEFTGSQGRGSIRASLLMDHQVRLFMHCKDDSGLNYSLSSTPSKTLEVNFGDKSYDEWPGSPRVFLPSSRIVGVLGLVPTWLYTPDLRNIVPKGAKFTSAGRAPMSGVPCDLLHTHFSTQMGGSADVDLAIDDTGRVRHFGSVSTGPQGRQTFDWHILSLEPAKNLTEAKFRLDIPLGFVPYTLPELPVPLHTGSMFPMTGWRANLGGALNLSAKLGRRGGLIAILGEDSEPSIRSRASLDRLRGSVPVVVLSDGNHGLKVAEAFDPTGQNLRKIGTPATPFFVMVDGSGKIAHLWLGYDADKAAAFESDVRNSFSAKP